MENLKIKDAEKQFLSQYILSNPTTKTKYAGDIELFVKICEIKTVEDFDNISATNMDKFFSYATQQGWSPSTTNQRLQIAKVFSNWLFKKGLIKNNSLLDFKPIRTKNNVHYTPCEEDCDTLLHYIKKHKKEKRLYLMVKLLLSTGLRRKEICNLKLDDLDKQSAIIKICGKGNKFEEQPITTSILVELIEYINTERKENIEKFVALGGKDKGYLFVSGIGDNTNTDRKNMKDGNKVCENSLYQQIKRYAKLAGIENFEKVSTHALRRAFVTKFYKESDYDLVATQKAARHSNVDTTAKCYINFNKQKIRDVVEKFDSAKVQIFNNGNSQFSDQDEYQLYLLLQKKFAQKGVAENGSMDQKLPKLVGF